MKEMMAMDKKHMVLPSQQRQSKETAVLNVR
jgi:hypothetical protein